MSSKKNNSANRITTRAIIIGLICATLECLIAPYNDYVIGNIFLAGGHFPVGPFFVITALILFFNVIIRKIHPSGTPLCPIKLFFKRWLLKKRVGTVCVRVRIDT